MCPVVLRCLLYRYNRLLHDLPCNTLHCSCHATQTGLICCLQFSNGCHISTTDSHGRYIEGYNDGSYFHNTCKCLGPIAVRAAAYTAGVVGALTLTAACAPSERYLYMSGPLAIGLGVVFVASIGTNSNYTCVSIFIIFYCI